MAEAELSVLSGQCLDRRISDQPGLIAEVAAWQDERNRNHTRAGRIMRVVRAADEVWQGRDDWLTWNGKPAAEIIPEGDSQLGASLGKTANWPASSLTITVSRRKSCACTLSHTAPSARRPAKGTATQHWPRIRWPAWRFPTTCILPWPPAAAAGMAPWLVVLGGGGYNPWSVGCCWAGIWATLNGWPIPQYLPPAAEAVLRRLRYDRAAGRDPPEHWFTTLRDRPRKGPVRDEVRGLMELALKENLCA